MMSKNSPKRDALVREYHNLGIELYRLSGAQGVAQAQVDWQDAHIATIDALVAAAAERGDTDRAEDLADYHILQNNAKLDTLRKALRKIEKDIAKAKARRETLYAMVWGNGPVVSL